MINGETERLEEKDHPTIFHELLQSDLPPQEKEVQRLRDEAQTILGAGLETAAWALTIVDLPHPQQSVYFKEIAPRTQGGNPRSM